MDHTRWEEQGLVVTKVNIRESIGSIAICYRGSRKALLLALKKFSYSKAAALVIPVNSARKINEQYKEAAAGLILGQVVFQTLLPMPVRNVITAARSFHYIWKGVKTLAERKLKISLLDGAALLVSLLRADFSSASGHVFLLGICDILERWVEKQKLENYAGLMSLNVDYVWLVSGENGQDVRIPASQVQRNDLLRVREGEMIPFDGRVTSGAGSVTQTSLTGNALPSGKLEGDEVFAGTFLEEGELVIRVTETAGGSQYEKLLALVDASENLKPDYEVTAVRKADGMVPYLLGSSAVCGIAGRSLSKMSCILDVDISYALKLSMPLAVLKAKEAAERNRMVVKGGRFMEQMALADTIVFDKTGTLTKAQPELKSIISFGTYAEEDLLCMAACMEEHFPHAMAKAITEAARRRGLQHEEMHSEVEHVVAHGIATYIGGKRAVIGSYHFVFEDEHCSWPAEVLDQLWDEANDGLRYLFLAIDYKLEAVFGVEDQLKPEAPLLIRKLRKGGFKRIVLLTGDSERLTADMARELGVDEYLAQIGPKAKAAYIEELQQQGHGVVMVGDGINDTLALSKADVGIAISEGAPLALEVADVIVSEDEIGAIAKLRDISKQMVGQMKYDFGTTIGANALIAAAGLTGVLPQQTASTLGSIVTITTALSNLT